MISGDRDEEIKAAAREWLLRLSLEPTTETERAQCAAWCAEDPRHAAAYRRYESIWQDAATLEELNSLISLRADRGPWWHRLRASFAVQPLRWVTSASVIAAIGALGLWYLLTPVHYATGIAEVRDIHLSDGSAVTLGACSSLDVAFRLHERRVALTSGVAFFSVSKNPARPFVVLVGDKEVRVVGTKFEIRRDPAGMRVSVVEGTVEVMKVPERVDDAARESPRTMRPAARVASPASVSAFHDVPIAPPLLTPPNPEERMLTAGEQVTTVPGSAIPGPQVMPQGEPAAWRHGRLVYVDAPLRDIIADANRYSREPIVIADERVANVRASITYPSDRIEEMLMALSRSLSLEIEHPSSGGTVLKAKERGG